MNVAAIVLSVINTILIVLILAAAGRIQRDQNENSDVFVRAHNITAQRVSDLGELVESALDCLLTVDARSAQSERE